MSERYWNMMTQKYYALCYLGCHLHRCVLVERWTDIILAIISTGSLAGLFITEKYRLVLTIILAIAQIVTAARPYLPYSKRIREIEKGLPVLKLIYMEIEKSWYDIYHDKLDDDAVNNLYYELSRKWEDADSEILKGDVLPRIDKFTQQANEEKNQYFERMFGGL